MKASYNFEISLAGIRSNMMSYALMLTSSRDDASRLVEEASAHAKDICGGEKFISRENDLKGLMFSIMRDIYKRQFALPTRMQPVEVVDRTDRMYHLEVPVSCGIEAIPGVKNVRELSAGIDRLNPEGRAAFTLYVTGYSPREIARALRSKRRSIMSLISSAFLALF